MSVFLFLGTCVCQSAFLCHYPSVSLCPSLLLCLPAYLSLPIPLPACPPIMCQSTCQLVCLFLCVIIRLFACLPLDCLSVSLSLNYLVWQPVCLPVSLPPSGSLFYCLSVYTSVFSPSTFLSACHPYLLIDTPVSVPFASSASLHYCLCGSKQKCVSVFARSCCDFTNSHIETYRPPAKAFILYLCWQLAVLKAE